MFFSCVKKEKKSLKTAVFIIDIKQVTTLYEGNVEEK